MDTVPFVFAVVWPLLSCLHFMLDLSGGHWRDAYRGCKDTHEQVLTKEYGPEMGTGREVVKQVV